MAVSTKIQHRRDTAANWTSTNPTLAAGEIGFETNTFKFKVGDGSTAWASLKYSQDASLLNGNANALTTVVTTGDITAGNNLRSAYTAGDEGGQIFLNKATTSTNLVSGVNIDVYQNKLRFWEDGGTNRGFYIDMSTGGASVGTNLVGGGGGGGTVTSITASSPLTGGTINTSGTIGINASSASTANYVVQRDANASFSVNALTATRVNYGTGTGAPTFTSYSAGVREVFYDNISGSQTGYAVGIDAGVLWHGLPGADGGQFFKWYGGVTEVAKLSGTGILTASSFVSNVASGTAPFAVTSNTLVTNLNADLLDGYNTNTSSQASTVVVRDASQNFAANTITANLFGTANLATNIVGGTANKGEIVYQSGVNTTSELTAPATNNSSLKYNTSTNAPYWVQPTLSNTYYAATTSAQLAGVVSDETGSGNLVFSTSPTLTTPRLANATTTATAGLKEFDGTVFYSTTTTTPGKALDVASHYYVSDASYSVDATSASNALSLLGGSTVGITVAAGTTYEYEGLFVISAVFFVTSQTPTINLSNTTVTLSPVVSHQTVVESGNNATGIGSASTLSAYRFTSTGIALTALTTGSRWYTVKMRGVIRVTGTGTTEIRPTIRFSAGSAENTWTVESGSIFKMTPIGNGTVTSVGTFA